MSEGFCPNRDKDMGVIPSGKRHSSSRLRDGVELRAFSAIIKGCPEEGE